MSIFAALAATAILSTTPNEADAANRPALPPATQDQQSSSATRLEDVVIEGRPLNQMIRNFVEGVAEPNAYRGLARWTDSVCVAVMGMERAGAEFIADRVSTVAEDIGIPVGGRNCRPNLVIVGTNDGNATARELVRLRQQVFYTGATGTNRTRASLRDFQETDRPVRWWQVSMPTDFETGQRAVRMSGDCSQLCETGGAGGAMGMAPNIRSTSATRLRTQIGDNMQRAIVVVDVDQVAHLSATQLADYIAMVSLAQIDPDAETSGYASILNVIDEPQSAPSLTDWDETYLRGLYSAERHHLNRRAGRQQIVTAIRNEHDRLRTTRSEDD